MDRVKILHILYSGQGGLGTYFMNFVNSDVKKDFKHYAFFYGIEPLNKELERFCVDHEIPFQYIQKKSKIDIKTLSRISTFIGQHRIMYLLLHSFSLSLLTLRGLIKNWKIIAIDHTPFQVKTKLEYIFTFINHCFSYKMIYFYNGHFNQLKSAFPFLWAGRNSHIIPKTVDTHFFRPLYHNVSDSDFTIGITARLIQGKRHDLIIKAIKILKDQHNLIRLKIAGTGPKENELKEMVGQLGLESQVEFVGLLTREDLLKFYQSLNAYIHASDGETICYSIMEAQACGLPILASDVEGINNYLTDGDDALLFQNELGPIIMQLSELKKNKSLQLDLGQKARNLISKINDKHNNARQLKELLIK